MKLHVRTAGDGPSLLLLHGWGLNSRVWDPVLPRLQQRFTTRCIDLPGHGASPWPPSFDDVDSLAASIGEALEGARAPCTVLGWSLGALAALALAHRQPSAVRALALVAATPKFLRSADWTHGVEPRALDDMATRLTEDYPGTLRDFLLWQVHGDEHARATLKLLRREVERGGAPHPAALRAGLSTLAAADLRARLAAIDQPTLVIAGERDRLCPPQAGAALAAALPRGRFSLVPRAAHAPFLSQPEAFGAALEDFLATPGLMDGPLEHSGRGCG